jgi:2C-methyl-D-erythritol 2,4-cyclodiphosphate synthase
MRLTGKDVWEVGVKMGWASGRYDPSAGGVAARAEMMAGLLNEIIDKRQSWLPDRLETEDAMRAWEATTPREKVLRLYKFLNQLGYTVIGIDAAIERERRKNMAREAAIDQKRKP